MTIFVLFNFIFYVTSDGDKTLKGTREKELRIEGEKKLRNKKRKLDLNYQKPGIRREEKQREEKRREAKRREEKKSKEK